VFSENLIGLIQNKKLGAVMFCGILFATNTQIKILVIISVFVAILKALKIASPQNITVEKTLKSSSICR
jgi:hypothetical protein